VNAVEVHVVALDGDLPEAAALAVLSPPERRRAASFRYPRDRRRFAVCRAALRHRLGAESGLPASEVALAEGERGKPFAPGGPPFNVSHCGELALIAVAAAGPVGIDLERLRRDRPLARLARRFLSPAEHAAMEGLGEDDLARAFYWCWTAKEAYLKALGVGLTRPLDSFDVSVDLSAPPRLLADRAAPGAGSWTLHRLHVAAGHAATLAVAGEGCDVRLRRWPGGLGPAGPTAG
jgi:4'-phosphopantetheinyl transferase